MNWHVAFALGWIFSYVFNRHIVPELEKYLDNRSGRRMTCLVCDDMSIRTNDPRVTAKVMADHQLDKHQL